MRHHFHQVSVSSSYQPYVHLMRLPATRSLKPSYADIVLIRLE